MRSDSQIARRQFLAAGALLSLGTWRPPHLQLHAGDPPRPNDAVTALLRIAAILDRPNIRFFGADKPRCECKRCRAIRRTGLECSLCGFSGEPVVEACDCRQTRASNIEFCERAIAKIDAGEAPEPGQFSRASLERLAAENLARPDAPCVAHRDDAARANQRPHCGHGIAWCPTCGNFDGFVAIEGDELAEVIRDARVVLRSAGIG